jgi:PTS system beta-glucosides-specific IIC component
MAKKQALDMNALAGRLVELVGGKENISGIRHCVTRVRFRLKDESLADDQKIKDLDGVISVVKGGGEYMVVIGNQVTEVYDAVCRVLGISDGEKVSTEKSSNEKKQNPVMRVLNLIVSSIGPALNMICAGGVMKGLLAILLMTGVLTQTSGMYMVLSAVADAVFYFLPIVLGYNMAARLGADPFLGLVIGASLVYPTLQGVDIELFGRTVNATYTSSFLPVVIITAIAAPLSKFFTKHLPKAVSGFLSPVLTLVITLPLGFAFIGPAATALGNAVNAGITALLNAAPVLAGIVVTGIYQVLVLFGIHSAMTSFSFMSLLSGNPDTIMALISFPCFAQTAVVLAIYLKTKDQKLKSVALPAFLSGIFGVTEPAIYGVTLPRLKMFVISCIGATASGIIVMLTHTQMYSFTGMGIVALLGMADPEAPNFIPAILAAAVTFAVSFIMAFIAYKDPEAENTLDENGKTADNSPEVIESPIPGKVIPLSEVPDETFSKGLLGHGIAVEPSEGKVYAPFSGTVLMLFETKHAIGLRSDHGTELLIHVGLETVNLKGEPFTAHVKAGDRIEKGQLLLEFDMQAIKEAGCSLVSSILVTNENTVGGVRIQDSCIIAGEGEKEEAAA